MLEDSFRNWGPGHFEDCRLILYEFFLIRKPHSLQALSKISCPVKILYGTDSVVYRPEYSERLYEDMKQAGIDVSLYMVPNAPHVLCLDHESV